jgi:hypothetical protein
MKFHSEAYTPPEGQLLSPPLPASSDTTEPESSDGVAESSPVPLAASSFVPGCPESSLGVGLPTGVFPESPGGSLFCDVLVPGPASLPIVLGEPVGNVPSEPAAHAPNENAAVTASALNHILRMREK